MDIWSMTRPALEDWFSSRGENPAKAAIMLERLYQRGLRDFSELPFAQRVISALSEEFTMELPETVARSGDDSTEKLLLEYPDGSLVESVLMRQAYGGSVCVSTQVGCAIYSGRKSDSAYSDPDRRTWNHCMYNCIFNSGWKKNKYEGDRKSTRLNSSHNVASRMPSSA